MSELKLSVDFTLLSYLLQTDDRRPIACNH